MSQGGLRQLASTYSTVSRRLEGRGGGCHCAELAQWGQTPMRISIGSEELGSDSNSLYSDLASPLFGASPAPRFSRRIWFSVGGPDERRHDARHRSQDRSCGGRAAPSDARQRRSVRDLLQRSANRVRHGYVGHAEAGARRAADGRTGHDARGVWRRREPGVARLFARRPFFVFRRS